MSDKVPTVVLVHGAGVDVIAAADPLRSVTDDAA